MSAKAQIQSPSQNSEPNVQWGPDYPEANRTPGEQQYYHDRNAHDLSPLVAGQHVCVQGQSTKRCVPRTVKCERQEPRSYEVQRESGATDATFAQQAHSESKWVPEMRTQIPDLKNTVLMFSPVFGNLQNHHIPLSRPAP